MTRWKAKLALLLAMLYLPATGHCLLEQAGWLASGGGCCEETAATGDSPALPCSVGCCPSEYAVYFSPAHGGAALTAEVSLCETAALLLDDLPAPWLEIAPECSPPELPKVWQFSYRTALPPRAPSFVS